MNVEHRHGHAHEQEHPGHVRHLGEVIQAQTGAPTCCEHPEAEAVMRGPEMYSIPILDPHADAAADSGARELLGEFSRRTMLRSAAAAAGLVGGIGLWSPVAAHAHSPSAAALVPGTAAQAMAMHVHASFSEGGGSMAASLTEAASVGVDAIFWAEHDWRMTTRDYRQLVTFTGPNEAESGGKWNWQGVFAGEVVTANGGFVFLSNSNHPTALWLSAVAKPNASWGTFGFLADSSASRYNHRGSAAALTIGFDIKPVNYGPDAYLELLLTLSMRPVTGGRPAGAYQISYRIGGRDPIGYSTQGILGVVHLPDPVVGAWSPFTVDPVADVAKLWPDLIAPEDNALYDVAFRVVTANGASAEMYVGQLTFNWNLDWTTAYQLQEALMSRYAANPVTTGHAITQHRGLEISWYGTHLTWFGDNPTPPPSPGATLSSRTPSGWQSSTVQLVHNSGGLISYNHPYGTNSATTVASDLVRQSKRAAAAVALVPSLLFGADILEVGMYVRAGMTFGDHMWLWDVLTRNGAVVTGTGVNDDHTAAPGAWASMGNRFLTYAWASGPSQSQLLPAISAGRCFVADPLSGISQLDTFIDSGTAVMGQVGIGSAKHRTITLLGTGVPNGATVNLIQVPIDWASSTDPGSQIINSFSGSSLNSGSNTVSLPSSSGSFQRDYAYRCEVISDAGRPIGFTQPIWLVSRPPTGAKADRLVRLN